MSVLPDVRSDVVSFVESQGWQYKIESSELKVKECPQCHNDRGNFEINLDTGQFKCWACPYKGHVYGLRRQLTGERPPDMRVDGADMRSRQPERQYRTMPTERINSPYQDLLDNKHGALEYLKGRGITSEAIAHFHVAVTVKSFLVDDQWGDYPCLVYPYIADGAIRLLKYRTLPPAPKAFARQKDMESVLFNQSAIAPALEAPDKHIILCASEIDVMSVYSAGMHNVIGGSIGEGNKIRDEWISLLEPFERITIVYDGDDTGRNGAIEMRRRLGEDRTFLVDFPDGSDANQVLVEEGVDALRRYIDEAKPAPVHGVQSAVEVLDDMMVDFMVGGTVSPGYTWCIPEIKEVMGNKQPGDLILSSGRPQYGKTTYATQDLIWGAHPDNPDQHPCLLACFEMHRKRIMRRVVQCVLGITREELDSIEMMTRAREVLSKYPFHIQYHEGVEINCDNVIDSLEQSYKRFGIREVVVDSMQFLSQSASDGNELFEQGKIARNLKQWAVAREAVVTLIAHPRKVLDGHIETSNDISGSGKIVQNADLAYTLYRQNLQAKTEDDIFRGDDQPMLSPITAFIPTKLRDFGGDINKTWLYLEGDYSRFRALREEDR